jgi:hypothetical protein
MSNCGGCDRWCVDDRALMQHQRDAGCATPAWCSGGVLCSSCDLWLPDGAALAQHERSTGCGRRCCGTCGRSFVDQHAAAQHERTCAQRARAPTLPCPGCGNMYREVLDAAQHFESG